MHDAPYSALYLPLHALHAPIYRTTYPAPEFVSAATTWGRFDKEVQSIKVQYRARRTKAKDGETIRKEEYSVRKEDGLRI